VVAVVRLVDAAHEEGGAREQHQGEGKLADDEHLAEALMAAISGHAARAALESAVQIEPEGEKGGGNAKGEGREQTGAERPAKHPPVDGEHEVFSNVLQPVVGPRGEIDGTDAAREGQQQGFDDQGAQQAGARGAEGGAHGELAGSGHRAGEQEIGQVGAGDEQHEAGEAQQHAENARAIVGCDGDVDGKGAPGGSGVDGGKVGSEAATEVDDEAVGLRAGERAGATPDEADPRGPPVGRLLFGESEWPEQVERTQMAPVVECGGQHADDLVGFAVDANGAADDVGVTPEAIAPESLTDDEDAVVSEDGFVGTEASAELRFDPEGGEKIGAAELH